MKINWNEKYTTISVYTVITFAACIIVYAIILNFTFIGDILSKFFSAASPLIWGLIIAYILNPIMMWTEKRIKKITDRKKEKPKLRRIISVAFTMIIFIAMIIALASIILPQVFDSVTGIINNFTVYIDNLEKWVNSVLATYPEILKQVDSQIDNLEKTLMEFINNIMPKIGDIMMKITNSTLEVLIAVKDFLIGIIVAVYFLYDKEHFQSQMKKIISAILPEKASSGLLRVCVQTNDSISGFISGKIVDSIIIGCLCFICMTIMKLDFVVLISVIVGITNIIPFFGPFIGAIPSALLLLVSTPKQVIPFLILIFILQQVDGNIIGPKILGQTTGISAFWVLFSILVGGGLFGFGGMILGVPIFAVIYSLINEYITYLLEKRNMPTDTASYAPAPHEETAKKSTSKKFQFKGRKKNKKK